MSVSSGFYGRRCHLSKEDALDYVLGYTCAHDVSARDWQKLLGGGQWVKGKSFDTFCPLGPALVTADRIPNPQILPIRGILNSDIRQESWTGDMIFSVAELISFSERPHHPPTGHCHPNRNTLGRRSRLRPEAFSQARRPRHDRDHRHRQPA